MLAYQMCFKPGEAPNGNEYVQFMVMLERNYLSFVMTSFTPTILANIISYSTNFFPRDNFDAAIGVNLTLLLVITTMYWLTLHSSLSHPFPHSLTRWLTLYNVKLLWGLIKQFPVFLSSSKLWLILFRSVQSFLYVCQLQITTVSLGVCN